MTSIFISRFNSAWQLFLQNFDWMAWNLFLALIPLALSVILFSLPRSPGIKYNFQTLLWGIGFLVFMAFLPNAPYVLTDLIHLIQNLREIYSLWLITLVLFPQYLLFILIGFEAYVLSLINLGNFLKRKGWQPKYIIAAELTIHALSAIGIYLGRFLRFNSWHIITEISELVNSFIYDLTRKTPLLIMFVSWMILTILYWIMKQVTLGIKLRIQQNNISAT
jgi:uncharacterized membrane protein